MSMFLLLALQNPLKFSKAKGQLEFTMYMCMYHYISV